MKLHSFRIRNFRSINDSGLVTVDKLTSLVGRNESGKSNLLLGLKTLNPPGGIVKLNPIKDFPRHRRISECTDDTPVVDTVWELDADEQAELVVIFPRAVGVTHVNVGRQYKGPPHWVSFSDLKPIAFSVPEVSARLRKIQPVIEAEAEKLADVQQLQVKSAIAKLATDLSSSQNAISWAQAAAPSLANLRKAVASAGISLPDREAGLLAELEERAATISADEPANTEAMRWVVASPDYAPPVGGCSASY